MNHIVQLILSKQFPRALQELDKILKVQPRNGDALWLMGKVFFENQQYDKAKCFFDSALQQQNTHQNSTLWFESAVTFMFVKDYEQAIKRFEKCLSLSPQHAGAAYQLCKLLLEFGHVGRLVEVAAQTLEHHPTEIKLMEMLSNAFAELNEFEKAIEIREKQLTLQPDNNSVQSTILMLSNYLPLPPMEMLARAKQANDTLPRRPPSQHPLTKPKANGKIRIGYISSDLKRHSVTYFLSPLLRNHDKTTFEIYAYNLTNESDEVTNRLKGYCDQWREIRTLSDTEALAQIEKDELDILVDLNGLTNGARLNLFTQRAAPIQMTWLGYPSTTGIDEFDYRLCDAYTDPEGMTDDYFSEKLLRLDNHFLCYDFDSTIDYSKQSPFEKNGYFTFGTFNTTRKINDNCLEAWAKILNRVENSHLILKSKSFVDEGFKAKFHNFFEAEGIDKQRIELRPAVKGRDPHLKQYEDIDLCLDTFPYNGTTTTCEALWMGTPTLTFEGDNHISRVGHSLMHAANLPEFSCQTLDAYIEKAVEIGNEPDQMKALRKNMRDHLKNTALSDGKRFAENMERVLSSLISSSHAEVSANKL